jgi:hypothetical protein
MAAWQFGTLAMFGYDLIVADPPWVRKLFGCRDQKGR